MWLRIAHRTVIRYDPPAGGSIQALRLTPRNHEGQYVVRWRIEVWPDARLAAHEDAFGNITHLFAAEGPLGEVGIDIDGQVETQNTDGVVRGTVERFPPSLFLRDTPLTRPDPAICEFARAIRAASGGKVLGELHAVLQGLHAAMALQPDRTNLAADAAEAFARKSGATADVTHVFIAAARSLGIPARFVRGYFHNKESCAEHLAHSWAEAYVPDLGWVGFDAANGLCPTDAHVRVAVGLDALSAAPLRGAKYGAGGETREVAIKVGQ
jgi:transglutaminase-like putative cysteine protease